MLLPARGETACLVASRVGKVRFWREPSSLAKRERRRDVPPGRARRTLGLRAAVKELRLGKVEKGAADRLTHRNVLVDSDRRIQGGSRPERDAGAATTLVL